MIYKMGESSKIKIEKYKNNRKIETTIIELSTIHNLNDQFEKTYAKFLEK